MSAQVASIQLLTVTGLRAGYGGADALAGVDFSLPAGGCLALLGPNGAGKSTVARTLAGVLRPTSGEVRLAGEDITGLPTHAIARRGLLRLPETRGIFPGLTVEENLVLGTARAGTKQKRLEARDVIHERFPMFRARRRQLAGTLSGGEQQMLALCHVAAVPPRVLVADELSLGLAPIVLDRVYEIVNQIRQSGTAILLIEQFLDRALQAADRVIILRQGKSIYESNAADLDEARYFHYMTATDFEEKGHDR